MYHRGSQPGGLIPLGGLERYLSSGHMGTFVSVGGTQLIFRGTEELKGWEPLMYHIYKYLVNKDFISISSDLENFCDWNTMGAT
jgi:hypothetical protein